MSKRANLLSILVPGITVFISSACIMVLELVASRLIARHLGSSLYTWTAVIGVVLAGITIGNYLGGRIADRFTARKTLAVLFGLCSVACVAVVILNNLVGDWMWLWNLSWSARIFTHVSLVFLVPSVLLGTISPVVAKMALDKGLAPGRTVGDIYAWGAAGSIAGTFMAGFYLIATMGTIAIIWMVGAILLLMGILYWFRLWVLYIWAAIFVALMAMGMLPVEWAESGGTKIAVRKAVDPKVIYEDEGQYCYIAVRQISKNPDRRVFMQDKLKHSEIIIGDVDNLQYFYSKIFAGITHGLRPDGGKINAMVIGGGGYAFPQYLEKNFNKSRIDVIEIDPGVTKAATEAFGLSRNTSINTFSMDARNYVDELLENKRLGQEIPVYDFIYEDAINDYSVPFQLVTKEFNEKIVQIIADDGAYLVNLIDTYDNSQFLGAVVNTIKQTFDYVSVVTGSISLSDLRNTYVIVATKKPIDAREIIEKANSSLELKYFDEADFAHIKQQSQNIVLTDDYAPVENLLAPVVRQSSKEILARKCLQQAEDFKQQQRWQEAVEKYEKAAQLNKSIVIKAYNEIGVIQGSQNNLEQAEEAFRYAIDYFYNAEATQNIIASLHLNLGTVLKKQGAEEQANEQYRKAIEQFKIEIKENPDADLYNRLGDTYALIGDFKSASDIFTEAMRLAPGNPKYFGNLIKSLELQGRFEEAIEAVKKQMSLMKKHGQKNAARDLEKYLDYLEYKKDRQK